MSIQMICVMFTKILVITIHPDPERKILIVFDHVIADMVHNKRLDSIVTELFIRGKKLNISLVFITQSYFKVPKDVKLNTTQFFIAKIPNNKELRNIAINHLSDISILNVLLNHIRFLLMMLRLHQIIL